MAHTHKAATYAHRKHQIVFVSLEVTIPPRDIIEFAAVVLDKTGFYEVESFSTLLKSDKITADSVAINGISEKMVEHAPTFEKVAHQIHSLLDGRVWAGYNIGAEAPHIRKSFEAIKHAAPIEAGFLDIAPLLKDHFGGRNVETKIDTLGPYFGLGGKKNRAAEDARLSIAILKNVALTLFLERNAHALFAPPTYAAANLGRVHKENAAKTPVVSAAAAPIAAVPDFEDHKHAASPPATEEAEPKRKKSKKEPASPTIAAVPAPTDVIAPKPTKPVAEPAFQQPLFAFSAPQPQQNAAAASQKVKPSPIQRPNPHSSAQAVPALPQQLAPSAVFSQIGTPLANGQASGRSPRTAAWAGGKPPAALTLPATPANGVAAAATPSPVTTTSGKTAAAPAPEKKATASAAPAATPTPSSSSGKKSWSQLTEEAERTKPVTPASATAASASTATPKTAPKKSPKEDGWETPKSKPRKEKPAAPAPAAAPVADIVNGDDGWEEAGSRKQKRAVAAARNDPLLNAPRDAAGKARDRTIAAKLKGAAGTGSSRPPVDSTCVALLETAIKAKKSIWIMLFNPTGNKPKHITPVGFENYPVLLKAVVAGEAEPAYFPVRKILEIRDDNTFDTAPAPIATPEPTDA